MLLSTTNVIVVQRNHHTVRNNVFYTGGNGMTIAISLDGEHIIGNLRSAEVSITADELQYVYATIVDGRLQLRTTTKQIVPLPPHHEREEGSFYQEGDVLYIYQRGGLEITSRVDIATIHNRRYIEEAPTYQESGIPSIKHGEIVFDIQGRPIVRGNAYLLTTTIFDDLGIAISDELEPLLLSTKANHNISKNKIVKIVLLDELRSELASYNDMDVELLGVALNSAERDENLLVAIQAIANIKTDGEIGDRLYIGDGSRKGDLITYNPRELHYKNVKKNSIGKVLPNNSIIFGQSNEVLEAVFRRQSRFLGLLPALKDRLGLVRVSAEPTEHNNPIAVETTDPRLYDARMPLPHTHSMVDIEIPDDFDWGVSGDFDPNEPVEEPDSIIEWIRYLNTTKLDISDSRLYDSREALPHTHFAREIDVESFGLTPKNSLQGAIERLQGELIGPEGGQIDGVLTINKTPALSRDIVNLDYIEGIRINQLQVVKVSRGDIELAAGETRSFTISFSEAGVYKVGNLIRGMIYYSSVSSESAVTMNVLDSSTGLIYTSSNAGGGAEIDLTPVTADFTGDMIIQLVNSGGATVVSVNLSYVVLDGNEAILLEDGESEIIVNSAALEDVDLRDILRRLNTTSENIEVGDASVVVDYFGLNLIELDFEEHGLSEDMAPTEGAVVSGGIFDKSELIELYDEICIACMVHADEWNDYCASEEHFLACQEAANVIESEEATIEELDDAILRLRSSTFVAFFTSGHSGTIAVNNLNAPYTVKFRRKGYNTPFDEWEVTGNSFSTTANFPNAAEVFITLKDRDVVSSSGNSSISIRGNSTLDKIVTWGELGTRQFIMQGSTRAFEVPNWLPSSVNNMTSMFHACINFNSANVSMWDTTNNTSLSHTFYLARKFNQNINSWSTDNVTSLVRTFNGASDFNQPLNNWNTSKVTRMDYTFSNSIFNQDINNWDTSKVTQMSYTFSETPFNKPLNSWNVESVTTMAFMFSDSSFNQPLSNWNPKNVTNMSYMFQNSSFNRPIGDWDVRKVTNMDNIFTDAKDFNQHLAKWDVTNVVISNSFPGFTDATKWRRTRPWFLAGSPTAEIPRTPTIMGVYEEILGNPEQRRVNNGAYPAPLYNNRESKLTSKNGIGSMNWRKLGSSGKYTVGTNFSIPNVLNSGFYEITQIYNQDGKIMEYEKFFETYYRVRGAGVGDTTGTISYRIEKSSTNYAFHDYWPVQILGGGGWSISRKQIRNIFIDGENGIHKIHDELKGNTIVIHPGGTWKN